MFRKYGVAVIIGSLVFMTVMIFTDYFCRESMEKLFPALRPDFASEDIVINWTGESTENLLPILAISETEHIVAQRQDYFLLNKIKPVELLTMMEIENVGETSGQVQSTESLVQSETVVENVEMVHVPENDDLIEQIPEAEQSQAEIQAAFVPHTLQSKVDLKSLADYETLVKQFYTIDAIAMVGSNLLNAQELSNVDLRVTKNIESPQILIYHTHSQEGFVDSVAGDDSTTIMGVGEHLAQILREEYGYNVLHHEGKYDVESRDSAYSRSLPDIKQVLADNPGIEVIIDLHRDAVANENTKFVMDLDGRPTARFMFFNGVSSTRNTGSISYLENPYQLENLAFSFQMKKVAEEYYPGLTRKNYVHGYRYNMHLLPRTLLIELGAQNNTLEEAMNACEPIAHILDMVLSGA